MNCIDARRSLCGLDGETPGPSPELALLHARGCPRCRSLALRLADAVLAAAGDELSCAECGAQLDRLVLGPGRAPSWADLDAAMPDRLQSHLAGCPDCTAELRLLRAMLAVPDASTPAAGFLPARFDTSFITAAPVPAKRRRAVPAPWPGRWPSWVAGWRALWDSPAAQGRRSQAGLAALTAILLFSLARLVMMDPQLRESLDQLAPFGPPAATADPESQRASARATAAALARQTEAADGPTPSPLPGPTRARGSAGSGTATTRPALATAAVSPTEDAQARDEGDPDRPPAIAPPATAPPGDASTAEPPYPPPDPEDPYPGSGSGGGGDLPDPEYPGPADPPPGEPEPDPTATPST